MEEKTEPNEMKQARESKKNGLTDEFRASDRFKFALNLHFCQSLFYYLDLDEGL